MFERVEGAGWRAFATLSTRSWRRSSSEVSMIPNKLKRLWAQGLPTINGWLSIGNAFTAEVMAAQGYDSVTIDAQHGALDISQVLPMFQAMRASGVVTMSRATWLEPR